MAARKKKVRGAKSKRLRKKQAVPARIAKKPELAIGELYQVTSLGGGVTLISERKMELTVSKACEIGDLTDFAGERSLRAEHAEYLLKCMKRGTFHPEWVKIITATCDGHEYRMNGQHTCWARSIGMPESYPCKVMILHYKCETQEDLRTLYASIDRIAPRTRANVMDSYLQGSDEFVSLKTTTLKKIPPGFSFWKWPRANDRKANDGDDVAFLLKTEYNDLALKVGNFLNDYSVSGLRFLFRASTVGAMFAMFNKAPRIAQDFWTGVATGLEITESRDPRLKLRTLMLQVKVSGGSGVMKQRQVGSEELYRMCIFAWNAFREGRSLQMIKMGSTPNRPKVK